MAAAAQVLHTDAHRAKAVCEREAKPNTPTQEKPAQEKPDLPVEPTRIDRRADTRKKVRCRGVGTFLDSAGKLWLTRVILIETSQHGAAARCPVPVEPLSSFSIMLDGSDVPLIGSVAHAKGRGGSYRLGLLCDPQKIAA